MQAQSITMHQAISMVCDRLLSGKNCQCVSQPGSVLDASTTSIATSKDWWCVFCLQVVHVLPKHGR